MIVEILCVTLPAAGAYAYNVWQTCRTREKQTADYRDAEKAKSLTEQQNASLIANYEENERLKARLNTLEQLVQEQQLSINRLADRY